MTRTTNQPCQVLVLQNGARHNYAVPAALVKEAMLSGFYTDACGDVGLGRLVPPLTKLPKIGLPLQRLANRRIPDCVIPFTRSFALSSLAETVDPSNNWPCLERAYSKQMERAGLGGANLIYSSLGWAPSFLRSARSRGIHVVTEFYIRPSIWRVSLAEHKLFPGWEDSAPYPDLTNDEPGRRRAFDVSDSVVVPSESVRTDILDEGLFAAERIHVVPYGIDESFFGVVGNPIPGRILFVGAVSLAKGIHYLAQAADALANQSEFKQIQFVVAGDLKDNVRTKQACSNLQFLGRIPRSDIRKEYEKADVLVFPTLSDSFGSVVLEAMASGVPVICSPYCTDAVQHGVNGFVVEPRDTHQLAATVAKIVQDRPLRNRLAKAARKRASEFSWTKHRKMLAETLQRIYEESTSKKPVEQ